MNVKKHFYIILSDIRYTSAMLEIHVLVVKTNVGRFGHASTQWPGSNWLC